MTVWSAGQQLALDQLSRIHGASLGAVALGQAAKDDEGWCAVDVTLDLSDVQDGGDIIEAWETVMLEIPPNFPFSQPQAKVHHARFTGLPHILWGRYICLYLSENDWEPSDGMFGFLDRLTDWLIRAATGALEEIGQPLHPPLTRTSAWAGSIVIPIDFPTVAPGESWMGMAVVSLLSEDRAEVVGWLPEAEVLAHAKTKYEPVLQVMEAEAWRRDAPTLLSPVVVVPRNLGFEFPSKIGDLVAALTGPELTGTALTELLILTGRLNLRAARKNQTFPMYVFVGAPMRGVAGDAARQTHLAAWRLSPKDILALLLLDLERQAGTAAETPAPDPPTWKTRTVSWVTVYEQRPQIVTRRDSGRPDEWLRRRRVLVLGCGALGARIAEHCVRAGAAHLILADDDGVSPGILVRQPYEDKDVGFAKAAVLAARLSGISRHATVIPAIGDILRTILTAELVPPTADLIIDATASRAVSARIESLRSPGQKTWPPVLTVAVGHDCQRGIATLALPEATGAGADILYNLALTAAHRHDLTDVYEDFYPDPLSREPFQPEPGCSDPTFRGSDTDASALAAQLLGWGIRTLQHASLGYYTAPKSLFVARLPGTPDAARAWEMLEWQNDLTVDDADTGYQIRFCPTALQQIRSESLTTAQIMGELVETGGMLLGRIDDACRVIWITAASGPPPDSERAQHFFRHGLAGVTEFIAAQRTATRGRQVFVGMWHTHPAMSPEPSATDLTAMQTLLVPGPDPAPQGLLAVFGGRPALWRGWLHGASQPDVYARLYQTTAQEPRAAFPL